ncbi:effector-associated domain EAD1-containing protein [Nodosilinea sp. AN01ver1]|uniref:effector-associated domain EAD1-containing protein n=1 Tax=Nodosilinea sp. AN01ver1 TaxID=3423362 RepID=UPI003D31461C
MTLELDQRRELFEALQSALAETDLPQLLYLDLGISINDLPSDGIFKDKLIHLIAYCERRSQDFIDLLVKSAYEINPTNEKLKSFHEKYFKSFPQNPKEKADATNNSNSSNPEKRVKLEIRDFDLITLTNCAKKILENDYKTGLVCIYISSESNILRVKFLERLKKQLISNKPLGKQRIKADVQALDPKINSINGLAKDIYRKYKDALEKERDCIHSLGISKALEDNSYTNNFLDLLEQEFNGFDFKSRLVILMYGSEKPVFPDRAVQLPVPEFTADLIWTWISPVAGQSKWGSYFWENDWLNCIEERCLCPENKILRIDFVYQFLEKTVKWLLDENAFEPEEFLERISDEVGV